MKKRRFKVLSIVICLLIALSSMASVGCSPKREEAVDKTKTQLYIATYGGGYGTAFVQDIEDRFEKWTMDNQKHYEEGKTGVQIFKTASKSKYTASALVDTIDTDKYEVYFITGDDLDAFMEGNDLYDITNIVTAPNQFDENGASVASKMRKEMEDHHNLGTATNPSYYSLPFVDGSSGLSYDKDVFNKHVLYFAKGGCPSEYSAFTQSNNANAVSGEFSGWDFSDGVGDGKDNIAGNNDDCNPLLSAGPDGLYGTDDDGLPATLEEFDILLTIMKESGVKSIIWSGQYETEYSPFLARTFANNYHGLLESSILKDGGGESGRKTSIITGFNGDEPIIDDDYTISLDNIEDVTKQAGYYYGLKMYEMILESGTEDASVWENWSHTETQYKYVCSLPDGEISDIAFILDGTWWENEANSANTFGDCVKYYGANYSRENRNFAYFPMPWVDESQIGGKYTMAGGGGSFIVSSRLPAEKAELIKDFIHFAFSDESLQRMTINIGIPAPFNYEMNGVPDATKPTETYYDLMSSFTRSFYNVYKKADIVYNFVDPAIKTRLKDINNVITYMSSCNDSGDSYTTFPSAYHGSSHISAKTFFLGLYNRATNK